MPADRHNSNPTRPLMPTLASNRTAKTPVAPRLAPSLASTSAGSRRSDRTDLTSAPTSTPNGLPATSAGRVTLSSNVTPRSSTRKSRAESTQTTPNDTPVNSPLAGNRPLAPFEPYKRDIGNNQIGTGSTGAGQVPGGRPRSMAGPGPGSYNKVRSRSPHSTLSGLGSDNGGREESAMFFHANEARSAPRLPVPTLAPKKTAAFFYADGKRESGPLETESIPTPPLSTLGRNDTNSNQFFHANAHGTTEPKQTTAQIVAPSLINPLVPLEVPTVHPRTAPFRSPSPEKTNIHLSYRKGASQIIRPNGHRPSPVSLLSSESLSRRRSSTESPIVRISHAKSGSLSSIDSIASSPRPPPPDIKHEPTSPISPNRPSFPRLQTDQSSGRASIESIHNPPEHTQGALLEDDGGGSRSPTAGAQAGSSLQKMNELAANARRERKVLDLEISNSSLLAINRQLEREVRKQKAELRRYRRLSRAGRFSTSTVRTSIGEFSEVDESHSLNVLEKVKESDEDEDEDDAQEASSSESSVDEESLSPSALAARDARHAVKDEKRLQLDLSKHRELLVDSQKMNQSLKRCLGWTEELIAEGKKALEYQVRVSDVQLGGRILTEEDHDHDHDQSSLEDHDGDDRTIGPGGGLLSPWTPNIEKQEEQIEALLSSLAPSRADRDSGIEIDLPTGNSC